MYQFYLSYIAVSHPPDIPLQILAGPGSGKTRVLTARIAHLIFHHRILPQAICAVTFTNKAANEMRSRLDILVGRTETGLIRMGTFHALCASFLRRHGGKLNLETNFTICDADERCDFFYVSVPVADYVLPKARRSSRNCWKPTRSS